MIKKALVLVQTTLILSGCLAAGAVITSPSSLKLKEEDPRFFNLTLNVEIGNAKYKIDYSWSCKQEKIYNANVGWALQWKSERKLVAKELDKDLTVYFLQPSAGHCFGDSENYSPSVLIGKGNIEPTILWVHNWDKDTKAKFDIDVFAVGGIRRTDHLFKSGEMNDRELSRARWLEDSWKNYAENVVTIVPESAWSTNKSLVDMFSKIYSPTSAYELYTRENPKAMVFGFISQHGSSRWEDPLKSARNYAPKDAPKVGQNGELTVDTGLPVIRRFEYKYEKESLRKNRKVFCYFGECVNITDRYNEIYFPSRKELIVISNAGLRLD